MLNSSFMPATTSPAEPAAVAAPQLSTPRILGIENAPNDDEPLHATRAALRCEAMYGSSIVKKKPEIIEVEDPPAKETQIAARYESVYHDNNTKQEKPEINVEDDAPLPIAQYATTSETVEHTCKYSKQSTNRTEERSHILQEGCPIGAQQTSSLGHSIAIGQSLAAPQQPSVSMPYQVSTDSHLPDSCLPSAPPIDEVTLDIHNSPTQMDEPSEAAFPMLEATLVEDEGRGPEETIYNAVVIRTGDNDTLNTETLDLPWWKRHAKSLFAGLVSLVVAGALLATMVTLVSSQRNMDGNGNKDKRDDSLPTISTPMYWYATWKNKRCDNDPSHQPDPSLGQSLYETVEECCAAEFWHLQDNECMANSLQLTTNSTPYSETKTTIYQASASTSNQASSHTTDQIDPASWQLTMASTIHSSDKKTTTFPAHTSTSDQAISQTVATSNQYYYATWENKCCDNDPLHQPDPSLGKSLYETVEECCAAEFWHLQDNECLINSLQLTTTSTPSNENKTTTYPTSAETSYHATSYGTDHIDWSSFIWKQQGWAVAGEAANDLSGRSVALSDDGKTLAVGAPGELGYRSGYVKVCHKEDNGSSWKQQGGTMIGGVNGYCFGDHVALSLNGKILAIGAPGYWKKADRPGYVQVYYFEGDGTSLTWKQLGQTINGETDGDEAGDSVSLSGDGRTLAIGAPSNDDNNGQGSGLVRVYHINASPGSIWNQLGQDIVGEAAYDAFGYAISLSDDGKTLAIGAHNNDGNGDEAGQVRVYHMEDNGTSWKQLGQDIDGRVDGDRFGLSLSLSSNGKTLAIGAPGSFPSTNRPGYVRVYHTIISEEGDSSWKQLGQTIDGEAVDDQSGISVTLSADGNTVAIGANGNDGNGSSSGHVRVYRMDATGLSWKQLGEDIDGEAVGDNSGWSVALSADGETLAIGAHRNDVNGTDSGHARVFQLCYIGDGACP